MSRWFYLARFFAVVPPMPYLMLGTFGIVTVVTASVIVFEERSATGALTPILLLQLFACASGFDVPARRGHYDLLLTHGETRSRLVIGHWAASALPGIVCWIALGAAVDVGASASQSGLLFSSGTIAAIGLVSTIPWAITLRLPRFSGAIGWLLVVTILHLVAPDALAFAVAGPDDWVAWLGTAGAVLVYPPLLVGRNLEVFESLVVLPALAFATASLAIAFRSAIRRDIPLEAAQ